MFRVRRLQKRWRNGTRTEERCGIGKSRLSRLRGGLAIRGHCSEGIEGSPDAMLTDDSMASKKAKGHAERAAINTPIQGAAADVVMQAMLRVHQNPRLRELGWEMVSQIHDEIIVEGPEESVDEAMKLVVHLMENPFEKPLSVALEVDAKVDDSWFKAK